MKNDKKPSVEKVVSRYHVFKDEVRGPATLVVSRKAETGEHLVTVGAKFSQPRRKPIILESDND